jgi:hypothetical protein
MSRARRQSTPHANPAPGAHRGRIGRFSGLTLAELHAAFVEKIGRATSSTDRRYLEWKIREADKGRVPLGPITRAAALPHGAMMTLPWRLPRATVRQLDAARERLGVRTRADLLAAALGAYLAERGEAATAALFVVASANEAEIPGPDSQSADR